MTTDKERIKIPSKLSKNTFNIRGKHPRVYTGRLAKLNTG
jgi:hypothetical protein